MKVATGNYFNLFSENGYDNYGLKVKFDIMIIFPESFCGDDMKDIYSTLELMLEGALNELGFKKPFAKNFDVEKTVKMVLDSLNYEYERIIVRQAVTLDGLN